jgi:pectinesterase
MIKRFLILILLTASIQFAQIKREQSEFPVDSSFTIYGTRQKVLKAYPYAELAVVGKFSGVSVKKNLIYCTVGKRELNLDLYLPARKDNKKFPAVILVHGGGWRSGNRSMEAPMANLLSRNGYAAATVDYRLSPEAKYPSSIYDVKAAVRWMRAHAEEFNIDSNKIAVYGTSSGGHLASFLGATNGIEKFEGREGILNHSSEVNAVVNIDGILDFTDPAESGKDEDPGKPSAGKQWLGYSFKDKPEIWIEASPVNYAGRRMPPVIFINSSIERFHAGRDSFIDKLKRYGIYYEVYTIPGTPHTFWLFNPWFEKTAGYVVNFLNKKMKSE